MCQKTEPVKRTEANTITHYAGRRNRRPPPLRRRRVEDVADDKVLSGRRIDIGDTALVSRIEMVREACRTADRRIETIRDLNDHLHARSEQVRSSREEGSRVSAAPETGKDWEAGRGDEPGRTLTVLTGQSARILEAICSQPLLRISLLIMGDCGTKLIGSISPFQLLARK
jgi:hypothetical protein